MKKLSKIKESVWSDIQKRSIGKQTRKEDDINLLDRKEFYEYIKNHFPNNEDFIKLYYGQLDNFFSVDCLYNLQISLVADFEEDNDTLRCIQLPINFKLNYDNVFKKLCNSFSVTSKPHSDFIYIKSKEGEINNQVFWNVLNFLVDEFKKEYHINESIWSDIQKRSMGKQVRKEDDIELLDKNGLYDYIIAHYEVTIQTDRMSYGSDFMHLPIIKFHGNKSILLCHGYGEIHCYFNLSQAQPLYDVLIQKFKVSMWKSQHYVIEPKDKINNQFFLDVIDTFIENSTPILRKKNVNESIWSDIQKRSMGKQIRKEDEVGNIKNLIPVDMGGSVLWADKDLNVDDEIYFTFDEASELSHNTKWRIPTKDEANELIHNSRTEKNTNEEVIIYTDNDPQTKLTFYKSGYKYADGDPKIYRPYI